MSRTLIQNARDNSDLLFFLDTGGGNYNDQSGNSNTITYPSDAKTSRAGVRCPTTQASFTLDMSGVQNFCVFAYLRGFQFHIGSDQNIVQLTSDYTTVNNGWAVYHDTSASKFEGVYRSNSLLTSGAITDNRLTNDVFISMKIDRRLSHESVMPYQFGIFGADASVDNNDDDGSAFANDTVYFGGSNYIVQALGIISFERNGSQWGATEQAKLYSEIIERLTI